MSYSGAHILYVEDDINLSFVTKDNLEKHGFQVTHCPDGEAGLECFQKGGYDLCLLDVMMPKMDGFALAEQIRKVNEDIPIIFLTAKSMKEDRLAGLRTGADDYLTKPFSIEELILKIEIFLRRSKYNEPTEADQKQFTLGRFHFDYETYTLTDGTEKQKLTQKEAQLLHYFCTNTNKVLKRDEILVKIWGDDDYFLGRSLDVFISRLRKYLKPEKAVKIDNVHGVGFVFKV